MAAPGQCTQCVHHAAAPSGRSWLLDRRSLTCRRPASVWHAQSHSGCGPFRAELRQRRRCAGACDPHRDSEAHRRGWRRWRDPRPDRDHNRAHSVTWPTPRACVPGARTRSAHASHQHSACRERSDRQAVLRVRPARGVQDWAELWLPARDAKSRKPTPLLDCAAMRSSAVTLIRSIALLGSLTGCDYGSSRILPVVLRSSMSTCACAACASGYMCSVRSFSSPVADQSSTFPARHSSSACVAT
jgi:hypothetical protein